MPVDNYVPLHGHSYFSVLDGLNSPEEVARAAHKMGCPAVALTDHGTCGGLFRFEKECRKLGIKPILGMETYFVDGSVGERNQDERRWHVTLWAKNRTGYKNLIRLSSVAYLDGFYYRPRIDWSILEKYHEGIIVGSGCASGILCGPFVDGVDAKALEHAEKFKKLFGDDFYVEIMIHKYLPPEEDKNKVFDDAMRKCFKLAKNLDIEMIYTHDSHYCYEEDYEAHDVLLSISTLNTVKNPKRFTFCSRDFYMKSASELVGKLKGDKVDHTYMLENTIRLSEKVEDGLIQIHPAKELIPLFPIPEGYADVEAYLRALVVDGLKQKGVYDDPAYRERMEYELGVIKSCDYIRYFLIVWDVVSYARREDIHVGPGRGSGVASLCLYALNVTALDPIKYDLAFERFLNPDRVSPPDVDLDFEYGKRDELFRYVAEKYGHDKTARIGTYGTLKAKDAIKRVAKAMDIGGDYDSATEEHKGRSDWKSGGKTLQLVDAISKCIPNIPDLTVDVAMKSFSELSQYIHRYPKVFEYAKKVEGSISNQGVHAAGILICREPIVENVPLRVSDNIVCTQFDMHEVEELGLLKYDFLALKNLTLIKQCVNLIEQRYHEKIDPNRIEPTDQSVFNILNEGHTEGIFQFEGRGITNLIQDLRIDSFNDMVVVNALYRPGTLRAKIDKDYCDYKHGRKKVTFVHPIMENILQETYGMMIYQENVMTVAMKIGGFTASEADKFRKGIGKKQPELIAQLKQKFISGCAKNGVDHATSEKIFGLCQFFSGYGFNKAHAAAYAYIAYQTAYLKKYYPTEFMCSLLTVSLGGADSDEKIKIYEAAARNKIKMTIHNASIDKSKLTYSIEGPGELRRPLTVIKGVGEKAVASIVENQPYASLEEFMRKVDTRVVNSRVVTILAENGYLDIFHIPREDIVARYEAIRKEMDKAKQKAARLAKKSQAENKLQKTLFDIEF